MKKEYYQTLSTAQAYTSPEEVVYTQHVARQLRKLLAPHVTPSSTVLDIGSSHGLLTRLVQILCNTRNTYGIDIKEDAVEFAQELYPSITFKHCRPLEIPFPDSFFDCIFMHAVLHHIEHKNQAHYVAEINRVLKPGCLAVILELNPYNISVRNNFSNNPEEQHCCLLLPTMAKKLAYPYGAVSVDCLGFSKQLRIPLGPLYAVCLRKSSVTAQ